MSRIKSVFERLNGEGRKALIPFITAGDPDAALTLSLMHVLVEAGADVIELGVPFRKSLSKYGSFCTNKPMPRCWHGMC